VHYFQIENPTGTTVSGTEVNHTLPSTVSEPEKENKIKDGSSGHNTLA
jgi:hypothetical protein